MIKITCLKDCEKLSKDNSTRYRTIIDLVINTIDDAYGGNFNPDIDGHWEYLDSLDDIKELPPKWLWENVIFYKDAKFYDLLNLRNNEFSVNYLIPEEIYSKDSMLVTELNSFLETINAN